MQNIQHYIAEKFRVSKDFVYTNGELQKTFKQTIHKNYKISSNYYFGIQEFEDIRDDMNELTDGFKIHKEVMDNIDEILDKMKAVKDSIPEYCELNEYLINYDEVGSLYSIVKSKCEYAYVENNHNECVVYYTEYFNDVAILGLLIRGQESVWLVDKKDIIL